MIHDDPFSEEAVQDTIDQLRADGDIEMAEALETMHRQGLAALECDEFEAGAQAMKRGQAKLYELMCKKFGPGWDKLGRKEW